MNQNLQAYYYLVQRCWFQGGPQCRDEDEPSSLDYLALFQTQNQAEAVAYHSAHKYAENRNSVVRTLLLPSGSGYGCSAAGKLFWVRRVLVERPIVDTGASASSSSSSESGAHVILTDGVIGGTGNKSSRRGTEAESNCVFVGPDSHIKALQYLQQQQGENSSVVSWLPFGVYSDLMQGWPDGRRSAADENNIMVVEEMMDDSQPKGRSLEEDHQQGHYNYAAPRPSKRICGSERTSFTPMTMETVDVYGTYTSM